MTPCSGCKTKAACKKAGKCMKKKAMPKRGMRAATNKAKKKY